MAASVAERVRDRTERGPWLQRIARAGLVARAALHLVVAYLTWRIAFGDRSEEADQQGALATVVRQPTGRALVALLAAGFLAYALWRLVQAVLDPEDRADGAKGAALRASFVFRSALYGFLTVLALSFALRGERAGEGGDKRQELTHRVLSMPFGRWVVLAVGIGLIAMGVYNAWRGLSGKYKRDLKSYEIDRREQDAISVAAVIGYCARAIAFGLVGSFLVRAAWRFSPDEPVGLDASLKRLADESYGPWLLLAVAIGLAGYGLYELALARYKRVLGS
ncbi:MAG TPA: DUF1206 domain-containing protein [Acidimicrobiales bacterium]